VNPTIAITGLGQHSASGAGIAQLRQRLDTDTPPQPIHRMVQTRQGIKQIAVFQAPEVNLPASVPDAVRRRMPRVAKMSFAAAREAAEDAFGPQLEAITLRPQRVGLVVGTAFGCMDLANDYQQRIVLGGPAGASPSSFSGSVQNAIALQLSIALGVQGPISTVTTMEHTAIGALRLGWDWLCADFADHVIVAIGDELSQFHAYAMAHQNVATPFDPRSDDCSATAGEGIAAFVLSREDAPGANQRHCQISDIQVFATNCPTSERYFAACYGAQSQWSRHVRWIQQHCGTHIEPACHAHWFGSLVTAAAFETLIAALRVRADHRTTTCVQLSCQDEPQTLTLR
jgi:3-oxoacyl-(acyl-carrier-protein) synthase